MNLVGQVVVKGSQRGNFARSVRSIQTILRFNTILMQNPFTTQIRHVTIDVCQRDRGYEIQIDIHNVNLVKLTAFE